MMQLMIKESRNDDDKNIISGSLSLSSGPK